MPSDLYYKIFIHGIKTFKWWDYGLDQVQEVINEEWSNDLARHLEQTVADYLRGKFDVD